MAYSGHRKAWVISFEKTAVHGQKRMEMQALLEDLKLASDETTPQRNTFTEFRDGAYMAEGDLPAGREHVSARVAGDHGRRRIGGHRERCRIGGRRGPDQHAGDRSPGGSHSPSGSLPEALG